jgi:hypothetical protein
MRALALFLIMPILAGCAANEIAPSLAPRPAEAIDPRVPVPQAPASTQVSPELREQLDVLVASANAGEQAFARAIGEAQRLAGAAGAKESESWVAAQQALSAAIAARGQVTAAIGEIDALGARWILSRGGIEPANLAAIEAAAARVSEIDRRQAGAIDMLQERLER